MSHPDNAPDDKGRLVIAQVNLKSDHGMILAKFDSSVMGVLCFHGILVIHRRPCHHFLQDKHQETQRVRGLITPAVKAELVFGRTCLEGIVMSFEPTIVQYNPELGEAGAVDVYLPDSTGPHPFVLMIHGGGWCSRYRECDFLLWSRLKPLNIALVIATYRLAPVFHFPCQYEDVTNVLAWLKTQGTSYNLDLSRSVLFGMSAGGHLALLIATRAIEEELPMPAIRGVVVYAGLSDLIAQFHYEDPRGCTMVRNLMGTTPDGNKQMYRDASPLYHLHNAVPPLWMAHGTADEVVPVAQARSVYRDLSEMGHAPIYLEARGLDHTSVERHAEGGAWIEPWIFLFEYDMLRFIQRSLIQI